MLTFHVELFIGFFGLLRYLAFSMSISLLNRLLVSHALTAYFQLLDNFSSHVNTELNKSRTASWTDPIMLAKKWF